MGRGGGLGKAKAGWFGAQPTQSEGWQRPVTPAPDPLSSSSPSTHSPAPRTRPPSPPPLTFKQPPSSKLPHSPPGPRPAPAPAGPGPQGSPFPSRRKLSPSRPPIWAEREGAISRPDRGGTQRTRLDTCRQPIAHSLAPTPLITPTAICFGPPSFQQQAPRPPALEAPPPQTRTPTEL